MSANHRRYPRGLGNNFSSLCIEPYKLRIELPGLPPLPNGGHGHWRKDWQTKKKWKEWVILATAGKRPLKPLEVAEMTLTRCSSSEPDQDNLAASFKGIIDGLRYAGIISDDKRSNVRPNFEWRKAKTKQGKIIIEVSDPKPKPNPGPKPVPDGPLPFKV